MVALAFLVGCSDAPIRESSPDVQPEVREVRLGVHSGPLGLDPHHRNEVATFSALSNVFEALTAFDADGRVGPRLAVRWSNPDDLTWRFELRRDVRFHDGRPLEAADVVASLERARSAPESDFASYLIEVREIRAEGEATVEIVTSRPFPILLNKLAFVLIVPRDAPATITAPIGTGPYRWEGGRDDGLLVRNEDWWGGLAEIPTARFVVLADETARVDALLDGDLDFAWRIPQSLADRVERHEGVGLFERASLVVEYLGLRVDRPPFDDPRVRRAIHLALDREEIVQRAFGGRAVALGQIVPEDVFGHDPDLHPPGRDLERALALLADAGHGDGLDAVLEYRQGRPAEILVEQLEEAGFRVEARGMPWSEVYPRLRSGVVSVYYGGLLAASADASDVLDTTVHSPDPERGYGSGNYVGYRNPAVDRFIEESGSTLDMMTRRTQLQAALAEMMEDLAYIPLVSPADLYGVVDGLEWTPRADGMIRIAEMSWKSLPGR